MSGQPTGHAFIYHDSLPVAVCPALEMNREGLQVHCGSLRYEPETFLEVVLDMGPGSLHHPRLPVRVDDCRHGEMALSYRELSPDLPASLPEDSPNLR